MQDIIYGWKFNGHQFIYPKFFITSIDDSGFRVKLERMFLRKETVGLQGPGRLFKQFQNYN